MMRYKRKVHWVLSGLLMLTLAVVVGCSSAQTAGLKSDHTLVRKAAVVRIGQAGDISTYDELVSVLQMDSDRLVRSQAAFALGELSKRYYSVGFTPLVDSLENDPSVFVRAAAALSLSATRDSRAVEPLVAALADDTRGEMAVKEGDRVIVYKACAADAARTSLEKIVGVTFQSDAPAVEDKRREIASHWDDWYTPRVDCFPGKTAVARQ